MSHCPSCIKQNPCTTQNPCCDCVVRAIKEEDSEDEKLKRERDRYKRALEKIANHIPAPSITAQDALNAD